MKIPSFEHAIEQLLTLNFNDIPHIMIFFENKSVQLYEFETGKFAMEFDFD